MVQEGRGPERGASKEVVDKRDDEGEEGDDDALEIRGFRLIHRIHG